MTPDPKALAVLLDAARACYGDDSEQVRWLLNPDAVRELLKHTPEDGSEGIPTCPSCDAFRNETHARSCRIAAAWRALGDPRGAADVERAHEEALREQERRGQATVNEVVAESRRRVVEAFAIRTPLEALAAQQFASSLNVSDNIFEPVRVEPLRVTQHRYVPPFRLASESEQSARARLDPVVRRRHEILCERDREESDARGMDAVENEARAIEHAGRDLFDERGEAIPATPRV